MNKELMKAIPEWESEYLRMNKGLTDRQKEILKGDPVKTHEGMVYGRMYADWKKQKVLMMSDFLWVEKYRPKTIEECILPANTKKTFSSFLKKGEVPNLLLAGPAGCGKTTVAKALCHELGADFYVINGSDEGRFLDTVRNQAKNFASTVSLMGGAKHKVIIIDEADNTTHDVQLLLRANIEEFYGNCRFIFTCNYKNKIIEPLHSRCAVVDFSIKGKEKQEIAVEFFKRLNYILDEQRVEYDKKVIVELINKHFPDWRRVLNECQKILCKW